MIDSGQLYCLFPRPPLCQLAVGPFAKARDAAQQEEEEEHADHNLGKVTIEQRKKGLRSSTKMDVMRLGTDSYSPNELFLSRV